MHGAGLRNSGCGETCNGTASTTCIGGAPLDVDCTALGFNTCDTDTFDDMTSRTASAPTSSGAARAMPSARQRQPSEPSLYGPTFVTVPLFTSVATQSVSLTEAASPPPAIRVS